MKKFLSQHWIFIILSTTTLFSILFYGWGINSWKFSYVGDDWAFYAFAKSIVDHRFLINPFNLNGVYSQNSVMVSYYQALFLQIFGVNNFAWRFSNIILIFPMSILFYMWVKNSLNKNIALLATLLFQSSFYLANFFKIGYPQPLFLLFFVLSLYVSHLVSKNPSWKNFLLLGFVLGISFYMRLGIFYIFTIWPYFLPLFSYKKKRELLLKALVSATFTILIATPGILSLFNFSNNVWANSTEKTVLHREFTNNFQIVINVERNFLLFYNNYDYFYNHFEIGPYLDSISQIFCMLGTIIFLIKIKKKNFLYILLAYVSTCFLIGLTSPYTYTATTRGIFFMPFAFIFTATGIYAVMKFIEKKKRYFSYAYIAFLYIGIICFNLYESQIGVFTETGYTHTAVILHEVQHAQQKHIPTIVLLILNYDNSYSQINQMMQAYDITGVNFIVATATQIPCSALHNAEIIYFPKDLQFNVFQSLQKTSCGKSYTVTPLTASINL